MLGPALGFASAGIGLLSGIGQQRTAASIANAQLKAQNAAFLEGRERDKGALAGSLFNQIFGTGTGADISFGREKEAQRYMLGPLAELGRAGASDQSKRERLARISPEAQAADRFENLLNMKRTGFQEAARMEGLFGPTGFSRRFTNI
jgi:hypothetical protein